MFTDIVLIDYSRPLVERAKSRKVVGPYHWTPAKPGCGRGFYQASSGMRVDPAGSSFDLRLDYASAFLPAYLGRNHTHQGYSCDDCGTRMVPIVARLSHGRGFLAGWTMGEGMLATLDAQIHAEPEDAARMAHEIAISDAERELEYREQDEEN